MRATPEPTAQGPRLGRWEWVLLTAILLLAAFMRLYRLESIPPGVTHDEADTGHFVLAVYRGEPSQVEAPYGYANEAFTMVSGALFMHVFGPTVLALRLHSAFFGMLTIVFGYLWARKAFGPCAALGMAALAAVSFWPVATSRFALNPQPAPALFTGAVWCLWSGLFDERPPAARWWAWVLGALFLGGSLWAYEVARGTAVALVAFVVFVALAERQRMRTRGAWLVGALVVGLALGAPHLADPAAWQRSAMLSTTLGALKAGDPRPLLATSVQALGTFFVRGDPFITYNIPGLPIFNPLVGALFCGGVLLCAWRWRRPACALTLLWLVAGLVPSMVVGAWNSTLHSMGMQPVVFLLPALCAVEVAGWGAKRWGAWAARLFGFWALVLFLATAVLGFRDYFVRWGQSRDVRAAYFHNLCAITDYVNDMEYSGSVVLSSPFPDVPLDPFIADLRVRRDDQTLRWCDARRAFVFPQAQHSLAIMAPNTPLDPALAEGLRLQRLERVTLRADDIDAYFDVFEWEPEAALGRFLQMPGAAATAGGQPLTLPVSFGGVLDLVAYELPEQPLAPGTELTLLSLWRVDQPDALGVPPAQAYGRYAVIFVHVLDAGGEIVAQEDRLDAPAWNWRSGDHLVQIHRCLLRNDLEPGRYQVALGVAGYDAAQRLPVVVAAEQVDERLYLEAVEVAAP